MELMTHMDTLMMRLKGKRSNLPDMASRSIPRSIDGLAERLRDVEISIEILETCKRAEQGTELADVYGIHIVEMRKYWHKLYDRHQTLWTKSQ